MALYAIWSARQLSPLGSMFPLGVSIATLVLAGYLIARIGFGPLDSALNFDLEAEHDSTELAASRRLWPNIGWFALLTAATALLGFVLATLVFFIVFLRVKAKASWSRTAVLTASAIGVLAVLNYVLLVELPYGLLTAYIELPWRS